MKIKRFASFALALLIIFSAFALFVSAEGDEASAPAADNSDPELVAGYASVVYCVEYNQFIWGNRIDENVAPCVAAKLMTGMVVYDILKENGLSAEEVEVVVSDEAVKNAGDIIDIRIPVMGFKKDNTFNCKDMLQALFVASANDAATALADFFGTQYLGGNMNTFVKRMNDKAEALGLTNTHFTHPAGLAQSNQYSTPREVALIAAAFYKYDDLVKLSDVSEFRFNGKTTVRNKNYLKNNYYVSGFLNKNAIGIIAGQEDLYGNYCLITAIQKEGVAYIFVMMCASGLHVDTDAEGKKTYYFDEVNAYTEMNRLINWSRESFSICDIADTSVNIGELRVENGLTDHVMVVPRENLTKLIRYQDGAEIEIKIDYDADTVFKTQSNGNTYDTVKAPLKSGQKVGTATFYYNGEAIATVDAVVRDKVDSSLPKTVFDNIKDFLVSDFMIKMLCVVGGIIIIYIIFQITMAVIRFVNKVSGGKKKGKSKKKPKRDEKTDTREL